MPAEPNYHGEGSVWIHTQMVCEELVASIRWRRLADNLRRALFGAALLHDAAKPDCLEETSEGQVSTPGHTVRGERSARDILWSRDVPFAERELICAMVRHHEAPFFLMDRPEPEARRFVHRLSMRTRGDLLATLSEADTRGRISATNQDLFERVELFREFCAEQKCLNGPRPFESDHTRFLYFRGRWRDPDLLAYDDTCCEVTLMSGLPGAGKDHWLHRNLRDSPVVSLDRLREQMAIKPSAGQGPVAAAAREAMKVLLRQKRDFVFNATNISRRMRSRYIDMFADYGARVHIVYVEATAAEITKRNRRRKRPIPDSVNRKLIAKRWDIPDLSEAHKLSLICDSETVS